MHGSNRIKTHFIVFYNHQFTLLIESFHQPTAKIYSQFSSNMTQHSIPHGTESPQYTDLRFLVNRLLLLESIDKNMIIMKFSPLSFPKSARNITKNKKTSILKRNPNLTKMIGEREKREERERGDRRHLCRRG
ncbi:hypothetical protein Drorol1_Dr00012889 [Drosera rotundifolia]